MVHIEKLSAKKGDIEILRNVTLDIRPAACTLLMGPNGSGKTSLARVLLGDPEYIVTGGKVEVYENNNNDKRKPVNLLALTPPERARNGLFVSFQNPIELPGVSTYEFLFAAYKAIYPKEKKDLDVDEMNGMIENRADELGIPLPLLSRGVNEGFSGGERKKLELLQMLVLQPKYIVLDEPDSGLDADSVKMIARALLLLDRGPGVLIISHDAKRLENVNFDSVCVMREGTIVEYDGNELIERISRTGYE